MALRDWLERQLSRGGPPDVDPDEHVELVTLPMARGPFVRDHLRDHGIDAIGAPAFNVGTRAVTDFEVRVPRRQFAEANEVLLDLGADTDPA